MIRSSSLRPQLFFILFNLLLLCSGASQGGEPKISYKLSMPKPATHLFEVEMRLESASSTESLDFQLPVWRPGRYVILDFASGVEHFEAFNRKNEPLRWEKTEKSTWQVMTGGANVVVIRYKVYADEFYLRTRGLNSDHAFVDGTSVFMYLEEYRAAAVKLTVEPYKDWHVTTGLDGDGIHFTASSYDYLVDCPLEIGTQKDFSFEVDGVPHILSVAGAGNWNADTLLRDFSRIARQQKDFWGEVPYKKYVFLVECTSNPTGATEHINSTIVQTRPYIFKEAEQYRYFLATVQHEFFHTWNVKQLRPHGIHPYDFTKENYSRELWIAEGTTTYYADILMVRGGFNTAEKFLSDLEERIRDNRARPGNSSDPISETSFDAWVKDSKGTEQQMNAQSDLYGKGADVSLLLDLEIRKFSSNAHSLDDVMKAMVKQFPLNGTGYTLHDFQRVAEEFAGQKLDDFFNSYIYGAEPLPWEELLLAAGIQIAPKDSLKKPWIGISLYDNGEKTRVSNVVANSPAENAGFEIGDDLLAVDGYRVHQASFSERISEMKAGDSLEATIFRDDRLREIHIKIGNAPVPSYTAARVKTPSPEQKSIYESWLGSKWPN